MTFTRQKATTNATTASTTQVESETGVAVVISVSIIAIGKGRMRNKWKDGEQFRKRDIDKGWQIEGWWHVDGCNGVVGIAWMPLPTPYEPQEGANE